MTTLLNIQLTCPVCSRTFHSHTVLPTELPVRKRTDFHEEPVGMQPLPYLVHTCFTCGYSGDDREFGRDACVKRDVVAQVWDQLTPRVTAGPVTGSEKYELAAKVAAWQRDDPLEVGDLLLRAAWCCVDEGDIEAERYFRRKAAWQFEAALNRCDGVEQNERASFTYLVGELWRRVGDTKAAVRWFNRVPSEIVDPVGQDWIIRAARRQRVDPREWFDS